jgi:hypothetical protein
MMHMHRRQPYAQRIARQAIRRMEQPQQRHRVRPTGNRRANAVARLDVVATEDERH